MASPAAPPPQIQNHCPWNTSFPPAAVLEDLADETESGGLVVVVVVVLIVKETRESISCVVGVIFQAN